MNILNKSYDFQRDARQSVKGAFSGVPQKMLLLPHTNLYRMVTLADPKTKEGGNELLLSPWWYPKETWNELNAISRRLGKPIPTVARTHLAVRESWNREMDWLCNIQLTKPVFAWRGSIRHQSTEDGSRIFFMGGLDQVYVPNLARGTTGLDSNSSEYAEIVSFGRLI